MGLLRGQEEGVGLTEQDIQNSIMLALAPYGDVFRTNAGDYWQGEQVYSQEFRQRALINLRMVRGLPNGFTDLMIVLQNGRVGFVEVKTQKGRVSPDQINFIKHMQSIGCPAGVARSPEDAIKIIGG